MTSAFITRGQTVPIQLFSPTKLRRWSRQQSKTVQNWIQASGFKGKLGTHCLLPDRSGGLKAVLAPGQDQPLYLLAGLARSLPKGRYHLETQLDDWQQRYDVANREREAARREVRRELADRISLCQRLLRRPVSPADELLGRSVQELREEAERLERELTAGFRHA